MKTRVCSYIFSWKSPILTDIFTILLHMPTITYCVLNTFVVLLYVSFVYLDLYIDKIDIINTNKITKSVMVKDINEFVYAAVSLNKPTKTSTSIFKIIMILVCF